MPLIKSAKPAAVGKNIKTEMKHGKPHKQAIAIALSVQRAAKKKKMASGGDVKEALSQHAHEELKDLEKLEHEHEEMLSPEMLEEHEAAEEEEKMAHGGRVRHASHEGHLRHKRMADGGEIEAASMRPDAAEDAMEMEMMDEHPHSHKAEKRAGSEPHHDIDESDEMELQMLRKLAKGGIVDAIRHKQKMMADGGEVDLQANADEDLNLEDQLSYQAARKKTYFDDSQISSQPHDSNLHGNEREEAESDRHDMVGAIRKKMKAKR